MVCVCYGIVYSTWHSVCSVNNEVQSRKYSFRVKGKAMPLQTWTGPEGSRRLTLSDFKTFSTWMWRGCQPYTPAAFTPQAIFLVLILVRGWIDPEGHSAAGRIMSMKNSNDTIGNQTRDLAACSAVPKPTASLYASSKKCCPALEYCCASPEPLIVSLLEPQPRLCQSLCLVTQGIRDVL
jgi:hypothetical protein